MKPITFSDWINNIDNLYHSPAHVVARTVVKLFDLDPKCTDELIIKKFNEINENVQSNKLDRDTRIKLTITELTVDQYLYLEKSLKQYENDPLRLRVEVVMVLLYWDLIHSNEKRNEIANSEYTKYAPVITFFLTNYIHYQINSQLYLAVQRINEMIKVME